MSSLKRRIFGRDSGVCHYCHAVTNLDGGTLDHVVPVMRRGTSATWNLVWSCSPCNMRKGSDRSTCPCDFCSNARDQRDRCPEGHPLEWETCWDCVRLGIIDHPDAV